MLQPGPQREAHASSHPSNDTTTKETMGRCNNLFLASQAATCRSTAVRVSNSEEERDFFDRGVVVSDNAGGATTPHRYLVCYFECASRLKYNSLS